MQAENRLHVMRLEHAAVTDVPGAAGGLLRGLEHQQHVLGQGLLPVEPAGQLQQNGHMAVVAAGVHPARVPGGEGQARGLGHRQGVGVGPEGDGPAPAKVKKRAEAALDGRKHPAAQPRQGGAEIGHGLGQAAVQLGNPVQRPAVVDDLHKNTPP